MENHRTTVAVPEKLRRKALRGSYVAASSFLLIIPAMTIAFILATGTSDFDQLGRGRLIVVGEYILASVVIFLALVYLIKFFLFRAIASSVTSLPELCQNEFSELTPLLHKRLTKTMFFYLSGKVPSSLQRIRVSPLPNRDGSFWMMATDANFSSLTFERYHIGDIPEPNDPDSLAAKYPAEVMGYKHHS